MYAVLWCCFSVFDVLVRPDAASRARTALDCCLGPSPNKNEKPWQVRCKSVPRPSDVSLRSYDASRGTTLQSYS